MKNVKKPETCFDWLTLFLCRSRSILPEAYKRSVNALLFLSTMKPGKFFRRLFGLSKKEKREEEKQRMRTEWENRLFNLVEEMEEEFESLVRFEERNRRRRAVDRRKKMELELEEERKRKKFYDLCQFFERRGYEFFTRTPMVKMGDVYPDLQEFVPPTSNRAWQRRMVEMYPSLQW